MDCRRKLIWCENDISSLVLLALMFLRSFFHFISQNGSGMLWWSHYGFAWLFCCFPLWRLNWSRLNPSLPKRLIPKPIFPFVIVVKLHGMRGARSIVVLGYTFTSSPCCRILRFQASLPRPLLWCLELLADLFMWAQWIVSSNIAYGRLLFTFAEKDHGIVTAIRVNEISSWIMSLASSRQSLIR